MFSMYFSISVRVVYTRNCVVLLLNSEVGNSNYAHEGFGKGRSRSRLGDRSPIEIGYYFDIPTVEQFREGEVANPSPHNCDL